MVLTLIMLMLRISRFIVDNGTSSTGLVIYIEDGSLFVGGRDESTSWGVDNSSNCGGTYFYTDQIESQTWHHVALVLDGAADGTITGTLTGYLDGVAFGSGDASYITTHDDNLSVGGISGNTRFEDGTTSEANDGSVDGLLDDFRVYNAALSVEDIRCLSQKSEGYWLFQGIQKDAYDSVDGLNGASDAVVSPRR